MGRKKRHYCILYINQNRITDAGLLVYDTRKIAEKKLKDIVERINLYNSMIMERRWTPKQYESAYEDMLKAEFNSVRRVDGVRCSKLKTEIINNKEQITYGDDFIIVNKNPLGLSLRK